GRLVTRRKEDPAIETVLRGEIHEEGDTRRLIARLPRQAPSSISRECRQELAVFVQDPHRNAAATQAACDSPPAVAGAHHKVTRRRDARRRGDFPGQRAQRRARHRPAVVDSRTRAVSGLGRSAAPPAIRRASARDAYEAPATNRISGPKLHAAGAPRK